jgi:hypothetical protein
VNGELEEIRKEVVKAIFKVLSWHLPGISEEIHENLSQDSWSPGFEPGTSRIQSWNANRSTAVFSDENIMKWDL